MKQNTILLNFNRGVISDLGLARQDIERLAMSASVQNNWMPRVLGSMMLRAGLGYTGGTYSNAKSFHVPFIYENDDTAILEFSANRLRVKVGETAISRPEVNTSVTNGTFNTDLSGWTDADDAGCTSVWATGGYMSLKGTGFNSAIRRQVVNVAGAYFNTQHALRLVVTRGVVTLKVGLSSGGDDLFAATDFPAGTYSIAFVPTNNFHIELSSSTEYASLVDSITVESAGDLALTTPWGEADLPFIRYDQSGDVVYIAVKDYQQAKVIRYSAQSWGIETLYINDGPFRTINVSKTRLTPSALRGDITLTASRPIFSSASVGQLFKIASAGQSVEIDAPSPVAADQFSDAIRVTGVGDTRKFQVELNGTWVGAVYLQRSLGEEGSWTDVSNWSANTTTTYDDDLDNQIAYYRIGVKSGGLSSGTVSASLDFSTGSITGICRVTGYTSATSVSAIVLKDFGSTSASENWYEGHWSNRRGWPTAVALHEGRLVFGGQSRVFLSVSDAYESFDDTIEGDSAAFTKTIPSGPANTINWLLSMKRLMVGTQQAEWYLRSSTQDEVLTPSNANMKVTSTFGSSPVQALQIDNAGLFVQRSTTRLMKSGYTIESDDYKSDDISKIVPEFLYSGVVRTAVQRTPDTRTHCVLGDGTVAVYLQDELEDVKSWFTVSTSGVIEDVVILPGAQEDNVYYCVKRTINGNTVRYLEKFAMETECAGGLLNKQADSFVVYDGTPINQLTGLNHLEGEEVVLWGDGKDYTYDGDGNRQTVVSGRIELPASLSKVVVGLPYKAQYKGVKLSLQSSLGSSLNQIKKINTLGVIMKNTHYQGLRYGPNFDTLDDLPLMEDYLKTPADTIHAQYDNEVFEFDGDWETDSRLCLEASAPRPCNILACVLQVTMHEKHDRQ